MGGRTGQSLSHHPPLAQLPRVLLPDLNGDNYRKSFLQLLSPPKLNQFKTNEIIIVEEQTLPCMFCCYNKRPSGGLNNTHLFLTALEYKAKVLANQIPGGAFLLCLRRSFCTLACTYGHRATNPIRLGPHPNDLIQPS